MYVAVDCFLMYLGSHNKQPDYKMKSLSVIELSNLYGMTRQAIYKQVNKGNLSKNSDGKIDLSEAIRVFGEPSKHVTCFKNSLNKLMSVRNFNVMN